MHTGIKLLIGFLSLFPLFYFVFFIANMFSGAWLLPFEQIKKTHIAAAIFHLALAGFYAIRLSRIKELKDEERALWIVITLATGPAGMLICWYKFIWNTPKKKKGI